MNILEEANRIVNGDRQADYSDPVRNFTDISEIATFLTKKELTAEDCCNVLIAVKLTRERFKHKEDNLIDLAGYTEILNRIKSQNVFIQDVSNLLCGSFEPDNKTSSATRCKCGREIWEHTNAVK